MDANEGEPEPSEGEVLEENSQSAYQINAPRHAENANYANSVSLDDLHKSVIDVDVVHQAGNEVTYGIYPKIWCFRVAMVESTERTDRLNFYFGYPLGSENVSN